MKDKTSHKGNDKPKNKQSRLGQDHLDYRELWGSPTSAFDGLVAGHSPSWMDAKADGFSTPLNTLNHHVPDYAQMVSSWQLGNTAPVCGIAMGEQSSHQIKVHDHHNASAPIERPHHAPLVIPADGGCL